MINKALKFSSLLFLSLIWGCSNSVGPENDVIPSTTISFEIVETSHVKLWIENSYQTRVITLVDEELDAGIYTFSINVIDSKGNRLPNGLYTYYLESNSYSTSRTMILR